jgi:ATP-dependent Clp protease, protease subunit
MKTKQFKASVQSDGTLEMLCYDEIGNDGMGGGVKATDFKAQMDRAAGTYDKICLRINSPGGDAFEGMAIGNLIKSQKKPVKVCVDGLAASAASIVAMCGDSIEMSPNSMMMIHNAWSVAVGNSTELRKMADTLDKVSASIAQSYVDKTGKSMDDIKSMMDAETWMSAEDCVSNGFAHSVTKDDDMDAVAFAKLSLAKAKYKNVPKKFQASVCACDCQNCSTMDCHNCTNDDCNDPDCFGCPNQGDTGEEQVEPTASNLSLYEARLALIKHT